jgi:hypothetical protein
MPAEFVEKASSKRAGPVACPPKAANGSLELTGAVGAPIAARNGSLPTSFFAVILLAGPDQQACAVFVSNIMYGFVLLLVVNRGLL